MAKKKAYIIIDGSKPMRAVAVCIKEALAGDFRVKISSARKFDGTELLASDLFFIGSKKQRSKAFAYLEEFFAHINLVSRKCGLYAIGEKPLKYLKTMINDSEAGYKELLLESVENIDKNAVKKWLNEVQK